VPVAAWHEVQWREGAGKRLSSRFARLRVRAAHHKALAADDPRAEEWLLFEWPKSDKKPTRYMLTTLPKDIPFARMVDIAKLRWRIERDYEELKQEVGLGHFEGRGGRGVPSSRHALHRHLRLAGLRVGDHPPSRPYSFKRSQASSLPQDHRFTSAALAAPTPYAEFARYGPMPLDLGPR
jgi:SRSO17 transposase